MQATVDALSGDAVLLRRLQHEAYAGRVHSVFARAINVAGAAGALLTLASRDIDDAPDTLVVDVARFDGIDVEAGERVTAERGTLAVGERLTVHLGRARPWTAALPSYPADAARLRANLAALRSQLAAGADGAAPVAVRTAAAMLAVRTRALCDALARGDRESAIAHGESILGLGAGLTPSGDDVVLGLLAALHVPGSPCSSAKDVGARIVERAPRRTNAISVAALKAAAQGRVRSSIVALLGALVCGSRDEMLAALAPVVAIGASSGRDIAAGILHGFDLHLRAAGASPAPGALR